MASIDKLTNIYNRQEMINRFNLLKKISDRNQNPITMLFLDIDFLKKLMTIMGIQLEIQFWCYDSLVDNLALKNI